MTSEKLLIDAATVRWLLGEEGDFECPVEQYHGNKPATYFWRRRLRAAVSTPPASQESAGEADGKMWAFLHDSMHEAYKKLSVTGGGEVYYAALDSIAAKLEKDVHDRFIATLTAEVARLTGELRLYKQLADVKHEEISTARLLISQYEHGLREIASIATTKVSSAMAAHIAQEVLARAALSASGWEGE